MRQFGNHVLYDYEGGTQNLTPVALDEMPLDKFADVVANAAKGNADKQSEMLTKADSYSFQVAHPEFQRTANNTRLINNWLDTKGITNPLFPDFDAAYEDLKTSGLLDIDAAAAARLKDRPLKTFVGAFSKATFDSVDALIANERIAAQQQVTPLSDAEQTLEKLPIEQVQTLLREGERAEQQRVNAGHSQLNADAWLTLHKEYVDCASNARLIVMQLKSNGVSERAANVEDYEIAAKQLRQSGLLKLNSKQVREQHAAEVQRIASEAVNTPGNIFDKTSESEMYNLPLEELRRRASGNYSGQG